MKCPVCGDRIPDGKSKCLRCGYECKALAEVEHSENNESENGGARENEPESEFREVSPDDVRMSGGSRASRNGSILDELFGGGIFGSITSIFDGLFGFGNPFDDVEYEEYDGRDEDGFPIDVFDRDFVEIEEVETFGADGESERTARENETSSSKKSSERNSRHGNHGRHGRKK